MRLDKYFKLTGGGSIRAYPHDAENRANHYNPLLQSSAYYMALKETEMDLLEIIMEYGVRRAFILGYGSGREAGLLAQVFGREQLMISGSNLTRKENLQADAITRERLIVASTDNFRKMLWESRRRELNPPYDLALGVQGPLTEIPYGGANLTRPIQMRDGLSYRLYFNQNRDRDYEFDCNTFGKLEMVLSDLRSILKETGYLIGTVYAEGSREMLRDCFKEVTAPILNQEQLRQVLEATFFDVIEITPFCHVIGIDPWATYKRLRESENFSPEQELKIFEEEINTSHEGKDPCFYMFLARKRHPFELYSIESLRN